MATTNTGDPYAPSAAEASDTSSGKVFTVTGQDWDSVVQGIASAAEEGGEESVVVNMGPQHPSTHGVLRLILELQGETVTEARAGIGYLHTGIEKNMEYRSWTQGVTFCTRMDYLSPFFNEATYVLGVEKLLGIEDDVPEKAQVMRVLLMELNRISSHLVALATGGFEMSRNGSTAIRVTGGGGATFVVRVHTTSARTTTASATAPAMYGTPRERMETVEATGAGFAWERSSDSRRPCSSSPMLRKRRKGSLSRARSIVRTNASGTSGRKSRRVCRWRFA